MSYCALSLLLPLAIALATLYDGAPHDGLIALVLASTEVAAAGLVALAAADMALALAVVTLPLGLTAAIAPVSAPMLVDASIEPGDLILRFSLVVLVPSRSDLPHARAAPTLASRPGATAPRLSYSRCSSTLSSASAATLPPRQRRARFRKPPEEVVVWDVRSGLD